MTTTQKQNEGSAGIVAWHDFTFGETEETALRLDCGKRLKNVVKSRNNAWDVIQNVV